MNPAFFATPAALRTCLQRHHDKKLELWLAVNRKRVAELTGLGLMQPGGIRAFEDRKGSQVGNLFVRTKDGGQRFRAGDQREKGRDQLIGESERGWRM